MPRTLPLLLASCFCLLASPIHAELTSEVKPYMGAPTLYVNGQPSSQILGSPYRSGNPGRGGAAATTPANISDYNDLRAGGIDTFNIYLRFPWTAPETYDFTGIDQKMDALLAAGPNARFIPRVLLTPQRWFVEQYPDEISRRDDGSPAGMFPGQNAGNNPSFSSDVYRQLSKKCMTAFINHLESKYGDHILGYQVGNGFGGEWLPFNSFWEQSPPPTKFGVEDYSPAALKDFRRWLKEKYKTDAALQVAWHLPKVTLDTATIPDEVERYTTTKGIFFDPAVSSKCPDWFTFYNESVANVLIENAQWVKQLTNRKKIVGAFYGYLWCNFPNLSAVHSGQLALTKVLNCPDVDFIASCYTYDNKQLGGPNNSQSLPAAVALHNKLYFNEVDTETHLNARQWRWGNSLNNPKNFEETKALLVRDYAYSLTNGNGLWWTDLHGGNFHNDQITGLFKQLKDIDDKHLNNRPGSNAEIAVILDESAFTYTGDGEPLWNALLTAQKQWEFAFIGAPWDCQLLNDIANPNLRDYKLYIFLNTFKVTPDQRAKIHAKLKKNNATALWIYAPGYIDNDKCSTENMTALTGIKIAEDLTPGELHVDVGPPDRAWTGTDPSLGYGTDVKVADIIKYYDHQLYLKDPRDPTLKRDLPGFRVSPRFYVDDPDAGGLGVLGGSRKVGFAVKSQDGWKSYYSAAPIIPAWTIRQIMLANQCHIYSDANDNIYANERFLAIYSPKGGDRKLALPKKSTVTDLLTNKIIAENATEFSVKLAAHETMLFRMDQVLPAIRAGADTEPSADPESPFWKNIPAITMDQSVLGPQMPAFAAQIRSRWTDQNLYLLFAGRHDHLTLNANPNLTKETPRLWEKDVFEVFLVPDAKQPYRYREFQLSPQGEFIDNDLDGTARRPGYNGEDAWNSGFKVKARIDEKNKTWFGEMQIPLSAISKDPFQPNTGFLINFYRQDNLPTADTQSRNRRAFLAWQPPGVWNPHHPEKFGILRLLP